MNCEEDQMVVRIRKDSKEIKVKITDYLASPMAETEANDRSYFNGYFYLFTFLLLPLFLLFLSGFSCP